MKRRRATLNDVVPGCVTLGACVKGTFPLLDLSRKPLNFQQFCEDIYIKRNDSLQDRYDQSFSGGEPSFKLLLRNCIEWLLSHLDAYLQREHMLCFGHRLVKVEQQRLQAVPCIPNATVQAFLLEENWQALVEATSSEFVGKLLTECSIFQRTSSCEFLQISGIKICHALSPRNVKRTKRYLGPPTEASRQVTVTSSSVKLMEARFLYGRSAWVTKGKLWVGLPPWHVFNAIVDPSNNFLFVKQLLMFVFPRQFSLRSGYTAAERPYSFVGTRREIPVRISEIVGIKDRSIPRVLRACYPLLQQACLNYSRLNVHQIFQHYTSRAHQFGTWQEAVISTWDVGGFVCRVLWSTFPHSLFGSAQDVTSSTRNNKAALNNLVKRYVKLRRGETLTVHDLMHGISLSAVPWLTDNFPLQLRVRVMEDLLHWLFEGLIKPLIKTSFYATESAPYKNRIVFFRHDTWQKLTKQAVAGVKDTLLTRMERQENAVGRSERLPAIRWVPKANGGFRPITSFSSEISHQRSVPAGHVTSPLNMRLVHDVLTFERRRKSVCVGSSVWGCQAVYSRLSGLKKRLLRLFRTATLPPLYHVTVDIKSAFDNLNQSKLCTVVNSLLTESEYQVRTAYQLTATPLGMKARFRRLASPLGTGNPLAYSLHGNCADVTGQFCTVTQDCLSFNFASREKILRALQLHLSCNQVKLGGGCFLQKKGIPQGSTVGTLLCVLLLGHFERTVLSRFLSLKNGLLMRMVDDFLFISTSKSDCDDFYNLLKIRGPEYGCYINNSKTVVGCGGAIKWCGLNINCRDLCVQVDYSRHITASPADGLRVDFKMPPTRLLSAKFLGFLKARLTPLFLDLRRECGLQSLKSAQTNWFQLFVYATSRYLSIIRYLHSNSKLPAPGPVAQTLAKATHKALRTVSSMAIGFTERQLHQLLWYSIS